MELTQLPLANLRQGLSEVVTRVQYERERVTITRNGKAVAAIISMKDLDRLLQLERENAEQSEKKQKRETAM